MGAIIMSIFFGFTFLLPCALYAVSNWLTRLFWSFDYPIAIIGFGFWIISKILFIPYVILIGISESIMHAGYTDYSSVEGAKPVDFTALRMVPPKL